MASVRNKFFPNSESVVVFYVILVKNDKNVIPFAAQRINYWEAKTTETSDKINAF